jgi:transposase
MNRYLRPADAMAPIYLDRDPVDFRKSFRGLAAIVEQELGHNPFAGGLYAFTNRRRNKIAPAP